jgi:hypothetical protein
MLSTSEIQNRPLSQSLIAPNSHKNPVLHRQQGVSGLWPWEKSLSDISLLFFFFSQQAEDRVLIKIKLCNILGP